MTDLSRFGPIDRWGTQRPPGATLHCAKEKRRPVQKRRTPREQRVRFSRSQGAAGETQSAAVNRPGSDGGSGYWISTSVGGHGKLPSDGHLTARWRS